MGLPQRYSRAYIFPIRPTAFNYDLAEQLQDTGAPVTPDLIAGYIRASAPGVTKIAGVNNRHAEIAAKYLQSEVDKAARGQYPSEFLTSDLMRYLDPPGHNMTSSRL